LKRDNSTGLLAFSPTWAENNPRTLHLLREEAEGWARHGSLRLVLPR